MLDRVLVDVVAAYDRFQDRVDRDRANASQRLALQSLFEIAIPHPLVLIACRLAEREDRLGFEIHVLHERTERRVHPGDPDIPVINRRHEPLVKIPDVPLARVLFKPPET